MTVWHTANARSIACQIDAASTRASRTCWRARRPCDTLAFRATGLSVSAVQSRGSQRVQKLERRGVISGYKAIIDDEARSPVSAYIAVTPTDYACESRNSGKTARRRWHHVVRFRGRLAQLRSPCVRNRQASSKSCSTSFTKPFPRHRNHDRAAALLMKVAVLW